MRSTATGGPPTARPGGLALIRAVTRDAPGTLARIAREQGLVVRLPLPLGTPVFLVNEPDAIREALTLTNHGYAKGLARPAWLRRRDPARPGIEPLRRVLGEGLLSARPERHREQRRLIQPLFHHERVAGYAATFADLARAQVTGWADGQIRDLHREFTELTMEIVARTVFDVDLDHDVVATVRAAVAANQGTVRRELLPWGRLLDRLPLAATRRWNRDRDRVDAVVYRLIASRRAAGGEGSDLLGMLLAARDDDGRPMPDRQVRDEAMTLLLAGHETTANALTWAAYLLATHPDEQHAVAAEALADVPGLPYTGAVVKEALRLYPPAWVLMRRLVQPRTVVGYPLSPGDTLLLSPWVVHRDPRWWPEPEQFRPRRWLATGVDGTDRPESDRPRFAYFPFGGGPRVCIGNGFAELEATVVLAEVLRHWRLEPVSAAPPATRARVTLQPRDGLPLRLASR